MLKRLCHVQSRPLDGGKRCGRRRERAMARIGIVVPVNAAFDGRLRSRHWRRRLQAPSATRSDWVRRAASCDLTSFGQTASRDCRAHSALTPTDDDGGSSGNQGRTSHGWIAPTVPFGWVSLFRSEPAGRDAARSEPSNASRTFPSGAPFHNCTRSPPDHHGPPPWPPYYFLYSLNAILSYLHAVPGTNGPSSTSFGV